jgi:hypothetical protein
MRSDPPNNTLDRPAGSHSLAAAGQRGVGHTLRPPDTRHIATRTEAQIETGRQ